MLIYSRFAIGLIILSCSIFHIKNYSAVAVTLFTIGLLTDIFDGIIARSLNVSNEKLRRLDSTIDLFFFIAVAVAAFISSPQFFYENKIELSILIGAEATAYLVCFFKFKKEIATHSISSKVWALILFATIVQLMMTKTSSILFQVCFYLGVVTRVEIIFIILVLRHWTSDVPGLFQAIRLRQGKPMKRHKLFNG